MGIFGGCLRTVVTTRVDFPVLSFSLSRSSNIAVNISSSIALNPLEDHHITPKENPPSVQPLTHNSSRTTLELGCKKVEERKRKKKMITPAN